MERSMVIRDSLASGVGQRRGLTLTEVLLGICIFAISIAGVSGAMRQGHKMLSEAQNKKVAFSNAQSLLEKYLTYSYAGMKAIVGTHQEASGCQVIVADTQMPPEPIVPPPGRNRIPYCTVQVICEYGNKVPKQKVSFSGIVPYPYLQVYTDTRTWTGVVADEALYNVKSQIFEYRFTPIVRSDLMIFYDIAVKVEDNGIPIKGFDLVYTEASINGVSIGIPTGTPILTQPVIANAIGVSADNVIVGAENVVTINWMKDDTGGKITPKKINMSIVRTENNR